jgi:osmotically inducible lipoprotein OsmB
MRRVLLAAAPALLLAVVPATSRADNVGIAFGVGTGLLVAGPVGAVIGGVVGGVWGSPFWGPPIGSHACWIDNYFRRHCRYYGGGWRHY